MFWQNPPGLMTKLTENERSTKKGNEVRTWDTQHTKMIFCIFSGQMPCKVCIPAGLVAASVCMTILYRQPRGKAGKRQSFVSNHREFAKGCLLSALF